MKKTRWFPAHIKPVRPGVYETNLFSPNGGNYAYWDGKRWAVAFAHVPLANSIRNYCDAIQEKEWRGLAEKP